MLLGAVLALLLALAVWLCVRFVQLYSASGDRPTTAAQDQAQSAVEGYLRESWPEYGCSYDAQSATLTVTRTSALSYDTAVQSGASIYCDETAPQTYQSTAELLRLDVMANRHGQADRRALLREHGRQADLHRFQLRRSLDVLGITFRRTLCGTRSRAV